MTTTEKTELTQDIIYRTMLKKLTDIQYDAMVYDDKIEIIVNKPQLKRVKVILEEETGMTVNVVYDPQQTHDDMRRWSE